MTSSDSENRSDANAGEEKITPGAKTTEPKSVGSLMKGLARKPVEPPPQTETPSASASVPATATPTESSYDIESLNAIPAPSQSSIRYAQSLERIEEKYGADKGAATPSTNASKGREKKQLDKPSNNGAIKKVAIIGSATVLVLAAVGFGGYKMVTGHNVSEKIELSKKYVHDGQFDKALESANAAVAAGPDDATALYARGNVFFALKLYADAIADYDKAIALQAPDKESLNNLGQTYAQTEQYDKALKLYNDAIAANPQVEDEALYCGRGTVHLKMGDYPKAIEDFETALRTNSKNVTAISGDALAYAELKKLVQAISMYTSALKYKPKEIDLLLHRGWCHQLNNEPALAIADIKKANSIEPKNGLPYTYEAKIALLKKQPDAALSLLNKAVSVDPACMEALQVRGDLLVKNREIEKAYQDYFVLSQMGLNSSKFCSTFALLADKVDKPEQSLLAYSNMLKANKNNVTALIGKTKALLSMKRFKEAQQVCATLLTLAPTNASAIALRGRCEEMTGNTISAMNDYVSAINMDGRNALAYLGRGNLYLAKKDYGNAVEDFSKAHKFAPDMKEASDKLAAAESAFRRVTAVHSSGGSSDSAPRVVASSYTSKVLAGMADKDLLTTGYRKLSSGNFVDAVALLQEAVTRQPGSVEARRYLAHSLLGAQQYIASVQQFDALQQMQPLTKQDQLCQANAYRLGGQTDSAIDMFLKMLVSHPNDGQITLGLAKAYADGGKRDKAMEICENAMKGPAGPAVRDYYATLRTAAPTGDGTGKPGMDIGG